VGVFVAYNDAVIADTVTESSKELHSRVGAAVLSADTRLDSLVGPILWDHSGPLCHALSLLSSLLLWTSIATAIVQTGATVATPGEWQC